MLILRNKKRRRFPEEKGCYVSSFCCIYFRHFADGNLLVLLGNQPDIPVKCNRDLIMLDVCLTTVIKSKEE